MHSGGEDGVVRTRHRVLRRDGAIVVIRIVVPVKNARCIIVVQNRHRGLVFAGIDPHREVLIELGDQVVVNRHVHGQNSAWMSQGLGSSVEIASDPTTAGSTAGGPVRPGLMRQGIIAKGREASVEEEILVSEEEALRRPQVGAVVRITKGYPHRPQRANEEEARHSDVLADTIHLAGPMVSRKGQRTLNEHLRIGVRPEHRASRGVGQHHVKRPVGEANAGEVEEQIIGEIEEDGHHKALGHLMLLEGQCAADRQIVHARQGVWVDKVG